MQEGLTRRSFLGVCGRSLAVCTSSSILPLCLSRTSAQSAVIEKGYIGRKVSPYYVSLEDQKIRCVLCPHACEVEAGERGLCQVRENIDGQYFSLVYANPCAVHIDPIEKKPFYHVLPASRSFSIATAGCNFDCKFCQNWEISQARPDETFNYRLPPDQVIASAIQYKSLSIASTYVEPVIFMEYMLEIGRLAKSQPLLKVMHSNGFINAKPLDDLCGVLDAACIDLKGFSEDYYQSMTDGNLAPVLDTLKVLRAKQIHTEIVTLIVSGKNDDLKQIRAMCQWIHKELGPDVPIHFSRFYPRYKLKGIAPTPVATLDAARDIAINAGLRFVYIGNVPEHPGNHTYCPQCGKILIRRIGYRVKITGLLAGKCDDCGCGIPGIWDLPTLKKQF